MWKKLSEYEIGKILHFMLDIDRKFGFVFAFDRNSMFLRKFVFGENDAEISSVLDGKLSVF